MNKGNNVSDAQNDGDVDDEDTVVMIDVVNKEVCSDVAYEMQQTKVGQEEEVCRFVMKYNGLC